MCTVGGKAWWSHDWSKWSTPTVTAKVSNVRHGTKSDVMTQERSCQRCGVAEMRKVIDLYTLMQ